MKAKKIIPALIVIALFLIVSSCKKAETTDTTDPAITLSGDGTVYITIGSTYTDAGATATDDVDGDLSASIVTTSNVNTTVKGTYSVAYSVTDAAGNTGTASRTVKVINSADYLAGGYSVVDVVTGNNAGTHYYNVSVSTSDTINNILFIRNFGEYSSSVIIETTLNPSDSTLNIASQSPSMMANPGTITGTGSSNSHSITSINYNCTYTSGGNDAGNAAFTKL